MEICNSLPEDIPVIFSFYAAAINYQRSKGYNLWPEFEKAMIEKEISEKRHWKIMENEIIVCIFSVMYSDPVIWGEDKNKEPAVYLHRIAVNPAYKGKRMMAPVRDWAITHGRQLGKKYLRMDTWGSNATLRGYYMQFGFSYLGQRHLDQREEHYGGSVLSLFEIKL